MTTTRNALRIPPSPPEPGTVGVLIAEGCTWTAHQVLSATQPDIILVPPSARLGKGGRR